MSAASRSDQAEGAGTPPSILVIDNYDSFTWNLVHYLRVLGARVEVVRNDALTADEAMARPADALLLSPGPGRPEDAGITPEVVLACSELSRPLLGICLGHQAIAEHFAAPVVNAPRVSHGKVSEISHDGTGLFAGIPTPFRAARYHSLTVTEAALLSSMKVTARATDGTVQGVAHDRLPIHGVQFHPESVATEHGYAILSNFLDIVARHAVSFSCAEARSLVA